MPAGGCRRSGCASPASAASGGRRRSVAGFDAIVAQRRAEADEFYDRDHAARPQRRRAPGRSARRWPACCGRKQYYYFDLDSWLAEHGAHPLVGDGSRASATASGSTCSTTTSSRCPTSGSTPGTPPGTSPSTRVALALVDLDFAKQQLAADAAQPATCTRTARSRPTSGTSATSTRRCTPGRRCSLYQIETRRSAAGDLRLPRARPSTSCCSTSPGGSTARTRAAATSSRAASSASTTSASSTAARRCPTGGHLEQADGTAWMALLLPEHARDRARARRATTRCTRSIAFKFVEHFFWIAAAMDRIGEHQDEMWDEEDGFFYDVLRLPDGERACASRCARWSGCCRCAPRRVLERRRRRALPARSPSASRASRKRHPELVAHDRVAATAAACAGRRAARRSSTRRSCAACSPACSTRTSSSARTASARCRATTSSTLTSSTSHGEEYRVDYQPAESDTGMFGGNSNWRGPVWFPVNVADHPRAAASSTATTATTSRSSARPAPAGR